MNTKLLLASFLLLPCAALAQEWRQTSADPYTRYELLDPASQSFRIIYDVTATESSRT